MSGLVKIRDWSLISGRGAKNGKIADPKLFVPSLLQYGSELSARVLKLHKNFVVHPPSVFLRLPVLPLPFL